MFSKKKRVTKELFQAIMKQGRTLPGSLFVFRYMKQDNPAFAFVAPKSVAKQAVERNRMRRVGYACLRSFPINTSAGIFFYKKGSNKATTLEIKQDIKGILEKARIN